LTDGEWALVSPFIPPAKTGGRRRSVDVGGTFTWAAPTYDSIRNNIVAIRRFVGFGADPVPAGLLYTAKEKNLAAYGQVNLGSGDLDGTIGAEPLVEPYPASQP